MRIGQVIGNVTLSRAHPSLLGGRWLLAEPLSWGHLAGEEIEPAEAFVVFDQLGAGVGHQIAISEGVEATMPFAPNFKPIDALNAAILDEVRVVPTRSPVG